MASKHKAEESKGFCQVTRPRGDKAVVGYDSNVHKEKDRCGVTSSNCEYSACYSILLLAEFLVFYTARSCLAGAGFEPATLYDPAQGFGMQN